MRNPTHEQLRAALRRVDLLAYVQDMTAGYEAGWFHAELCEKLEKWVADCVAKKSPRLMIFAPPRHGKSQIGSRALPAWMLGRHPERNIILASYGQSLANNMSRDARKFVDTDAHKATFPDFRIGDRDAVEEWKTSAGGGLKAVGVGGPITGEGGDLIIDDPVKGAAEAASELVRDGVNTWFGSDARTRVPPGGGCLIIMTRWHEADLAGARLELAKKDPSADQWEIVSYKAIATEDEPHRKAGDALHPERWSIDALAQLRSGMSPYKWGALFQQSPVPESGGRIKGDWLRNTYSTLPADADRPVHSWDTAIKAGQLNDYSVCTVASKHGQRLYIREVKRSRLEFPELLQAVKSLAMRDNPRAVLIEDKGSGQQLIQMLRRDPDWKWSIIPVVPKVDKVTRMDAVTPWLESGRVWIPDAAHWLPDWLQELLGFPVSSHDDQIDSLSQLLDYHDSHALAKNPLLCR